jgi:hypothetical protein
VLSKPHFTILQLANNTTKQTIDNYKVFSFLIQSLLFILSLYYLLDTFLNLRNTNDVSIIFLVAFSIILVAFFDINLIGFVFIGIDHIRLKNKGENDD